MLCSAAVPGEPAADLGGRRVEGGNWESEREGRQWSGCISI